MKLNFKTPLAIAFAFAILPFAWCAMTIALASVLYLLTIVFASFGPLNELHLLSVWILGATFGGFCATAVTPRVLRGINPDTFANIFCGLIVVLLALGSIPSFFGPSQEPAFYLVYFGHALALVIGGKIGQSMAPSGSGALPFAQREALRHD